MGEGIENLSPQYPVKEVNHWDIIYLGILVRDFMVTCPTCTVIICCQSYQILASDSHFRFILWTRQLVSEAKILIHSWHLDLPNNPNPLLSSLHKSYISKTYVQKRIPWRVCPTPVYELQSESIWCRLRWAGNHSFSIWYVPDHLSTTLVKQWYSESPPREHFFYLIPPYLPMVLEDSSWPPSPGPVCPCTTKSSAKPQYCVLPPKGSPPWLYCFFITWASSIPFPTHISMTSFQHV